MGISGALGYAPPIVEEEPLPPPQAAPPAAPPPAAGGGLSGALGYAPEGAPPPPPDNYQPGSTYVPPQDRGLQTAPPPPAPEPQSGPAGLVQEIAAAPTLLDKGGALLNVFDKPNQESQTRLGQAAIDRGDGKAPPPDAPYSLTDPNTYVEAVKKLPETLGDFKDHPEHLLFSVAEDSAQGSATFGEIGFNEWAQANPALREQYRDNPDGLYQEYLNDIGYTLESGGLLGLGKGMVQQSLTDPTTVASIGISGVAGAAAKGAALAGKTGIASGIVTKVEPGLQTVIDPVGMVAEQAIKGVVPRIPGIGRLFRPTAAVQETQATNAMSEALRVAAQEGRDLRTPPGATGVVTPGTPASPTPATPVQTTVATNGAVPPATSVVATPNGVTPNGTPAAPVAPTPNGAAAAPVPPQRQIVTQPVNVTPTPPPQIPVGPGSQPVIAPRPRPRTPGSPATLPPIMRDPARGWVMEGGAKPPRDVLRQAYQVIADADPDQLRPFPTGRAVIPGEETKLSQYLAAMTEQKLVLDDWPSSRTGSEAKRKAGRNWVNLFGQRIEQHGKREIDRLINEYQTTLRFDTTPGADVPINRRQAGYWDQRAMSIIEAARKGNYDESFSLTSPRQTHTYVGKEPAAETTLRTTTPPRYAPGSPQDSIEALGTEAFHQTIEYFDPPARNSIGQRLKTMLDSPAAFSPDDPAFKKIRKDLYRSGAWAKEMPEAVKATDAPSVVARKQKQLAAYERYQAFRDYHEQFFGRTADTRSRRAPDAPSIVQIYGTLAPQQRAIADAVAREFRAHLDQMGLGHVRLGLVDRIAHYEGGTLRQVEDFAEFDPETGTIDLAINRALGDVLMGMDRQFGPDWALRVPAGEVDALVKRSLYQSLNHETVHALRQMGVFTPDEWRVLVDEAHATGRGQWAANMYDDLAPAMQDEEAVAELFADFALDRRIVSEQSRSLLQRVVDFFKGFVTATARNDPEGVMRRMLSGEIGGRGALPAPLPPDLMQQRSPYRGTVYHGSARDGFDVISANPEQRQYNWASSHLGAFFAEDIDTAKHFAGDRRPSRTLYEASLELNNPHEMTYLEMADKFFSPWPEDIARAKQFRAELEAAGHDGIIVYNDPLPGKPPSGEIAEIISFRDVPVASQKQFRRGAFRNALPGSSLLKNTDIAVDAAPTDFDGMVNLPDTHKALLRNTITYQGTPTDMYTVLKNVGNDVEHLRYLADADRNGLLTNPQDKAALARLKKTFDAYEPRYDWADPKFDPAEVERIAATHTADLWRKETYPNTSAPPPKGAFETVKQVNSDIMAAQRAIRLANPLSAPRQFVVQALGNVFGFGIAHPAAMTDMFKPQAYVKAFRAGRDPKTLSLSQEYFKSMGHPTGANAAIETGAKALSRNATQVKSPTLRMLRDILSPKPLRELIAAPDEVARGSLARKAHIPLMKREQDALPKHAVEVLDAFRKNGKILPVDGREIQDVVSKTLKAKKQRGDPVSRATGQDLKDALIDAFKDRVGPGSTEAKHLNDFASRVGQNYTNVRNTAYNMAGKEANRVLFSWDDTNLDAFLKHFTLFHYWASRASGLYMREMMKKPALAATFVRIGQALVEEAENNGYPDWLRGYTRLVNSPAGITLLMNPTAAIGAMTIFADWQWGRDPMSAQGDMTLLGTLEGIVPLFFGPLVQYGGWLSGAFGGEDARVPGNLLGIEPMFARAAQIINLANLNGHLPPGMLRDANGAPILIDQNFITKKVQDFGVAFAGRPPMDLDAGSKANTKFLLQDVLREGHPEWATDPNGENELTRTINEMEAEALAGNPSPEWLEAERRMIEMSLSGPDFPGLPAPLQTLLRLTSPVPISAVPETKAMEMYGFGNTDRPTVVDPSDPTGQRRIVVPHELGMGDEHDPKDLKNRAYDTLDMALLEAANEDWWEVGNDTGIREAARVFSRIGKANVADLNAEGTVKIAGKTYTSADLAEMKEGERYRLAEQYLNAQGFTVADKDAYYEARDEVAKAHPDLAGYQAYKEYVNAYPGGPQAFVNDAMRTSPSFARFMQQLPYPPGSEDWYAAVDWTDAYYAIEGRRGSIYDPTTLPDTGTAPGLAPGETFASHAAMQEVLDAAAAGGKGDGNGFTDFVGEIERSTANLFHAQELLNQAFPGTGWRAGIDYIPYNEYQYIKGVWKENGVYPPDKGDLAYEYYYEWLPANATSIDPSVRAFLSQRDSASSGESLVESEPVTPEMIAAQQGFALMNAGPAKMDDAGQIDTSGLQQVIPRYDVPMRTGPSVNNPFNLTALSGQPMWVTDIEGEWAQVVSIGGEVGWVPASELQKVA